MFKTTWFLKPRKVIINEHQRSSATFVFFTPKMWKPWKKRRSRERRSYKRARRRKLCRKELTVNKHLFTLIDIKITTVPTPESDECSFEFIWKYKKLQRNLVLFIIIFFSNIILLIVQCDRLLLWRSHDTCESSYRLMIIDRWPFVVNYWIKAGWKKKKDYKLRKKKIQEVGFCDTVLKGRLNSRGRIRDFVPTWKM